VIERASASDFETFRGEARRLLERGVTPARVQWREPSSTQGELFAAGVEHELTAPVASGALRVPRRYVTLAERAVLFRAPDRFALAYRVLHRLQHGEARLLEDALDPDIQALEQRSRAVGRDEHRMHAFVRFRRTLVAGEERFIAWYAPQHLIVRLGAPFFARRFASQWFAILTPDESAFWDRHALSYGPGAPRTAAPSEDELEELFRTYCAATYNPARRNPTLFSHHVPAGFRSLMPELAIEPQRLARRAQPAFAVSCAAPPPHASLAELASALAGCRACPLGASAIQAVAGRGPENAAICLVGEQPGDGEDRTGLPFVGPAGQVLDRALAEVKLPREQLYVTNAVKHFNFEPKGKRRLHVKPQWRHVLACRPWLQEELDRIKPDVVVCLGSTAAQSLFGRRFRLTDNRGKTLQTPWGGACLTTFHPSAVLRAEQPSHRDELYASLVSDLRAAARLARDRKR
jgi:DNA polymerase